MAQNFWRERFLEGRRGERGRERTARRTGHPFGKIVIYRIYQGRRREKTRVGRMRHKRKVRPVIPLW